MSDRSVEGISVPSSEFLELDLARRQAAGAAHTLNNVFTSLLGEIALLGDECKGDPVVEDAIAALREQLERCVRVVRNGLTRPDPGNDAEAEVDLGLLLSRCARVLEGTLSRRIQLSVDVPDASWVVRGERAALELLVLGLTFRLGDLAPGGTMAIAVSLADDGDPGKLALRFDVEASELPVDARQRLVDPRMAESSGGSASISALHTIADAHGTHLQTDRTGPEALRLSLLFSRLA